MALLSSVKVSVLRAPMLRVVGEKLLLKPGRLAATTRSAVAVPLLPALEVRSPETLVWVAIVLLVTLTKIEQAWPPERLPPESVMVVPPAGALSVPPQSESAEAGSAIVTSAGRLSVNASPETDEPEKFSMSKRSVGRPFSYSYQSRVKITLAETEQVSNIYGEILSDDTAKLR